MNQVAWHKMRKEVLLNIAKKAEEAANLPDEQYAGGEGAIVWQEMEDNLKAVFAFTAPDELKDIKESTTCSVLHETISSYLSVCEEQGD